MTSKTKPPRRKRQTWKDVLRPFDDEYCKMLKAIDARVQAMSRTELDRLSKAISKPTDTNCGWTMYAVREHVKNSLSLHLASEGLKAMGL